MHAVTSLLTLFKTVEIFLDNNSPVFVQNYKLVFLTLFMTGLKTPTNKLVGALSPVNHRGLHQG